MYWLLWFDAHALQLNG